jgi:hypothetical protein
MTIGANYIKNQYEYIILSTDEKPINSPPTGSILLESDSLREFKWTGSEWLLIRDIGSTGTPFKDRSGKEYFNTSFGDRISSSRIPRWASSFRYPLDTRSNSAITTNGGAVGYENNLLKIQSGTNINGTSSIFTLESLPYNPMREGEMGLTTIFSEGKPNSYQRVGMFDSLNGIYFGYENDIFGLTIRKDGVDEFIPQSEFNRDKLDGTGYSEFILDKTKMNISRLTWGYLGIMTIAYYVFGGLKKGWILANVYDKTNEFDTTHISDPYLNIRGEVGNTGNNTNIILKSGSVYAGIIANPHSEPITASSREFTYVRSYSSAPIATNGVIAIFHNKPTLSGVLNKIEDLLLKISLSCEGNKPVKLILWKLKTPPTGGSWADIDSQNSNMEVSINATLPVLNSTNAEIFDSWALAKSDSIDRDVFDFKYLLLPNGYAAFTYTAISSTDLEFANRWSERH